MEPDRTNRRSLLISSDGTPRKISRRLFLANTLIAAGGVLSSKLAAHAAPKAGSSPTTRSIARNLDLDALRAKFKGQVLSRSDANFSSALYDGLFNRLYPTNRQPDVVAVVKDEQDVCNAIKFARANGLKVTVRGGGHNWCSPSLRHGGMMIDLSNMNQVISIDAEARKAVIQPIISNRDIQKALNAQGMSYPSGHCPTVKVSGYLLSGGMSWNQGVWGPGVGSVEAIEIVTADGELITASREQNNDYFWAARGAGCGFFGVATRYHLKLYPLPKHITASAYYYDLDDLPTVAEWLGKTASRIPSKVELSLWLLNAPEELAEKCRKHAGKIASVTATAFADSEEEAKEATKLLDECPVIAKCLSKTQNDHVNFEKLFDMSGALWPTERRNLVAATFSNGNLRDVIMSLKDHFLRCPSKETLIMYAVFTGANVPAPLLEDAAFSMSARLYGGPWSMWKDPADNQANIKWHERCIELMKPHIAGYYLSESDTVKYPDQVKASFVPGNYRRIEELRKKHDPEGVFYNFYDGLS